MIQPDHGRLSLSSRVYITNAVRTYVFVNYCISNIVYSMYMYVQYCIKYVYVQLCM